MDVTLTDEQQEWLAAADRLASTHAVATSEDLPPGSTGVGWASLLELGAPALRSPELCGVEATGVETVLAVEALARRLSPIPGLGQGVIAPQLLEVAGADELTTAILEGTHRFAPALSADLQRLGRIDEATVVFDAADATHALVLDGDRLAAVVLPEFDPVEDLDLTRQLVDLGPDPEKADLPIGEPIDAEAHSLVEAVSLVAFAADLLGVMDGAVTDAVAYATDRKQFGTQIGTFQAVQHLLADATVQVEGVRSCVWHAAWAIDHLDGAERLLAARTAKAAASRAGRDVVETTVQVFGGIAITWEHLSHLRLRRMHLDRTCLGSEDVQHQRIAAHRLENGAR